MIIRDAQINLSIDKYYASNIDLNTSYIGSGTLSNNEGLMSVTGGQYQSIEVSTAQQRQINISQITNPDGAIVQISNSQSAASFNQNITNNTYSLAMLQRLQASETWQLSNGVSGLISDQVNSVFIDNRSFSLNISRQEAEQEQLDFVANGQVLLDDGRQVEFSFNQNLQRSYFKEEHISVNRQEVVFTDPLVITFDPTLSENSTSPIGTSRFSLDMDLDGQDEQLTFTGAGSGFLVFDRNNDGEINHGGEMFGGVSGKGFTELAQHDLDGNMWIDENDAIFSQLQIWTEQSDGNRKLISLKEAGVGAIYLNAVSGEFTLTDSRNDPLGQIKQSGLFLKENGEAGAIMQIDLAKLTENKTSDLRVGLGTSNATPPPLITPFSFGPIGNNTIPNTIDDSTLLSQWLSTEDGFNALNNLIEKLASGEASLADIGLFLSPGVATVLPSGSEPILTSDNSSQISMSDSFRSLRASPASNQQAINQSTKINEAFTELKYSKQMLTLLDWQV